MLINEDAVNKDKSNSTSSSQSSTNSSLKSGAIKSNLRTSKSFFFAKLLYDFNWRDTDENLL